MNLFLKSNEVSLLPNGQIVNTETQTPILNYEFISIQLNAERIVLFAQVAKGKNFSPVKVYSKKEILDEIEILSKAPEVQYVVPPQPLKQPLQEALLKDGMDFVKYHVDLERSKAINEYMKQFEVLSDFENYGLFFVEGHSIKINKIYTIKEVLEAVTQVIDIIDIIN
jgi:hypothetical protein